MSVKFGIRDIKFSPEFGFKLNGKKVLLKGIANHHTLGALGAAAYPKAIEKRLRLIKDFGFNHVRTSHNPYSTDFLNICDSLGILVVDELYDKWLKQYSGGRKDWTAQWQHDLPEWIKRDRNHPSVIMWSLGNELQGYSNLPFNDWGVTAYRLQKTLLERYDTTRQVTVAMHPRYRSLETDSLPAPLARETDIASYNYRYMYFPGDSRRFPDMIFYQSEANRSGMGPNFYEPDNDRVIGLAYWGMIDYLGESAGWPAKGWEQGVFDMSLQPKPEAWFIKSMFSDEPVVHIGIQQKSNESYLWNDVEMKRSEMVDHWNFRKGDVHDITVFSNADEVELRLNGKSLKRRINNLSNTKLRNRFEWKNVAYSPGILEATAYNSGKKVAIHRIETAGKAVKLVAEPENAPWRNDGYDLCHVVIRAVDAKGRTVPGISSEIEISLSGDASIVAVDNGDMHSNELHIPYSEKSARRSLYRGKALVILRAGKSNTPIELKAKTANLHPAKINMQYVKR
ncbi:glycoside hydrolase family 2 TIM barrel-domain containing protein [uncultured Duncaniella sp.]|nr:glycoside hydrolase family 2 TIM barrel-domain containing protein [uncultured Duncaniella sp.]